MKKTKLAVFVLMGGITGLLVFNKTKTAPPSDLRDAVGSPEFNTDIPVFAKDDQAIPVSKASPAEAPAEDLGPWSEYIGKNFGGIKAAVRPFFSNKSVPSGKVVESVNLESILDANLSTKLTFKTSSGNTVHVSGAQAANCAGGGSCGDRDKYFLVFHTDSGQTVFVNGQAVANYPFHSGEKTISFKGDAEQYKVKLNIKLSSPGQSRLKVESQGRVVLEISLDQLTAALAEKGKRLSSGSQHNLFYNTEVLQDGSGNGYFGKGRVITFSPRGTAPNQTMNAAAITAAGVALPGVEPGLGFRIAGGVLELYQG